ncbi:MAG: hypothetical protein A2885_15190 [Sphingopyxis sp. RIFCSPHIGHO2_01_FULL_65_24]|nr:MAG: hypothetical protein A2885_15190 [Sphingopyxis sp. RIFCSPHIGHO2_01_FULL_65_24]
MRKYLTLFAVLAVVAPVAHAAEDRAPPPKAPSEMTPTEIKAYNEGLDQTHPYYIKCRKTLEIGSLVKKNRVCYTNEKWKDVLAKSSQNGRDTAEAFVSKGGNSSN